MTDFDFSYLSSLGQEIVSTFADIANFFSIPVREIIRDGGKGTIFQDITDWLVNNVMTEGSIWNEPLIAWLFGSLFTLFVVCSLVKWLLDVIPVID